MTELLLVAFGVLFLAIAYLIFKIVRGLLHLAVSFFLLLVFSSIFLVLWASSDVSSFSDALQDDNVVVLVTEDDAIRSGFLLSSPDGLLSEETIEQYNEELPQERFVFLIEQQFFDELQEQDGFDELHAALLLKLIGEDKVTTRPELPFFVKYIGKSPAWLLRLFAGRLTAGETSLPKRTDE